MILIVDDMLARHDHLKQWLQYYYDVNPNDVLSTYTYDQAIRAFKEHGNEIHRVYLDFDLDYTMRDENYQGTEKTGLDVADYMIEMEYTIPTWVISINPVGAQRIYHRLNDAGIPVIVRPIFLFTFDLPRDEYGVEEEYED